MTGQDAIIAMRRAGNAPRYVWVQDFAGPMHCPMQVRLTSQDVPEQQDWRFLIGLTALVEGFDAERVQRIASACAQYAKRTVANTMQESPGKASAWAQVTCIQTTDTEGIATWNV